MKSRISYSGGATALTVILTIAMLLWCIAMNNVKASFYTVLALYIILIFAGLFFGAVYIKADKNYIILGSPLRKKKIPMSQVESVELFQATMGAIRIFASGGFMGYWGIFREGDIGKYYGFYGKASDCFLVRLKDGSKYVLGCNEPDKMVQFIKSQITPSH
ncbi:MAG: hypothetical protein HDT04_04800 [Bacteroidales bacterium]|nr:hypothetical protein [Bacteroidales bacterium]